MGGRKRIKRRLSALKTVRTWQLLLILIPLIFLAATLLRFDHLRMVELRSAVLEDDKTGDSAALATDLKALEDYVFSHIIINVSETNGEQSLIFGTGVFYLEQSYLRAADAAIESAEQVLVDDSNPYGNIYEAARQVCQPQAIANGWKWSSQAYLDCWTTELAKYPSTDISSLSVTADIPSTELYRLSFASPLWAPTAAGFVILLCLVLFALIIIRFFTWLILQLALWFIDLKKS